VDVLVGRNTFLGSPAMVITKEFCAEVPKLEANFAQTERLSLHLETLCYTCVEIALAKNVNEQMSDDTHRELHT
jgi:hypothetical protein